MIFLYMESSELPTLSSQLRTKRRIIKNGSKNKKNKQRVEFYISPFGRSPGVKGGKRTRVGPLQVRNKLSGMTKFRGRFSLGSGTRSPLSILGLDPLHLFLLLPLRRLCIVHSASRLKCPTVSPLSVRMAANRCIL